jgi:hypothetical protein
MMAGHPGSDDPRRPLPGALTCVLLLGLFAVDVSGPTPSRAQSPDTDAGHLEFDFMIGRWDIQFRAYDVETGLVTSALNAIQQAEYANGDSLIVDEWTSFSQETGEQASHGVTLRTYSRSTGRWQHAFLRSGQDEQAAVFSGEWRDNEMHASGATTLLDGRVMQFRLRFYEIESDSFNWMEEWSIDGGANWVLAKTQVATRIEG